MYIQYVEFYGILSVCLLPEDRKTDIHMCEPERVSVIVPVFNVEEYLEEALDSLLMQTYRNLEILVVDDGSTDGSGKICDEYAKKDKRIQVIHQDNQGLSGARNTALELMSGDMVMFLDSDDAWLPETVYMMVETLKQEQADIVVCRFLPFQNEIEIDTIKSEIKPLPSAKRGHYDRITALHALANGQINYAVWNKIYRRELWNNIRFPYGHVYEDVLTDYCILNHIQRLYVLDYVLYLQRIHKGSITNKYSETNIRDYLLANSQLEEYISAHIQGVFLHEHLSRMRQIQMNTLMNMYYHYTKRDDFSEELRQRILKARKSMDLQKQSVHTWAVSQLLRLSPELLRNIHFGKRLIIKKIKRLLKQ